MEDSDKLSPKARSLRDTDKPLTTPLPDEELIFLVNGHRSRPDFDVQRLATLRGMILRLESAGIDYRDFRSILDFGCGCGRILAGWEHLLPKGAKLYGVDINRELVTFCQDNIPFATTLRSAYSPPLPFAGGALDFMYAASVWTHLDEKAATAWAKEAARLLQPGGVLIMSFHGSYYRPLVEKVSAEALQRLDEKGFYLHAHLSWWRTFRGSNAYASFMTHGYAVSLFDAFELLASFPGITHGPHVFAAYQDMIVLRRKNDA